MVNISEPQIGKSEIRAVTKVLMSGVIAQGPKTLEFENNFAKYCGSKYAVAFSNGTAAIHSALFAMGIKPGDEVITTPFTFVATANPILMLGAKVVFCDISEDDYCIDPAKLECLVTNKTKAIIPVDLYGQIYDYGEIGKIAEKYKLKILEDACQAVGAEQNGVRAGKFGNAGAFSFYATKNMTTGEGGMVVTDDDSIMEGCKMYRHHGQSEKVRYEYLTLGYNYRITDIQSAIGLEQLKKIDSYNRIRRRNAEILTKGLNGIKGLYLPLPSKGNTHVYHQYTVRVGSAFGVTRDGVLAYLRDKGINAGVYYPKPLHLHKHFVNIGFKNGDFPVAEALAKEVISLPVHPALKIGELKYIISVIHDLVKEGGKLHEK